MNDLQLELSRSLKIKYDGAYELTIYGFLLVFTDNIHVCTDYSLLTYNDSKHERP